MKTRLLQRIRRELPLITAVGMSIAGFCMLPYGEFKDNCIKRDLEINYPKQYFGYLSKKQDYEKFRGIFYNCENVEGEICRPEVPVGTSWVGNFYLQYLSRYPDIYNNLTRAREENNGIINQMRGLEEHLKQEVDNAKAPIKTQIDSLNTTSDAILSTVGLIMMTLGFFSIPRALGALEGKKFFGR